MLVEKPNFLRGIPKNVLFFKSFLEVSEILNLT